MTSKYHQSLFDFLGIQPKVDPARLDIITQKEKRYNITIDESVKEWLVLKDIEDILEEYSSYYWIEKLENLGDTDYVEGLDEEFNGLVRSRKCIPLFNENLDGRLEWFLAPDGTDDPKVLLRAEIMPDFLMPHPHRFSTLLFLNIWDANVQIPKEGNYYLKAKFRAITEKDLKKLRPHLDQKQSTFYLYATRTIHRFQKQEQFLSIWDNSGESSTWYFSARTEEEMEKLLTAVREIEGLKSKIAPVYADNDAQGVVKYRRMELAIDKIL